MLAGAIPLGTIHLDAQDWIRNDAIRPIAPTRPALPSYAPTSTAHDDVVRGSADDDSVEIGNQSSDFVELITTEPTTESNDDSVRQAQFSRPVAPVTESRRSQGPRFSSAGRLSSSGRRSSVGLTSKGPAKSFLSRSESNRLPASDLGGVLGKSTSIQGVGLQKRNPIVNAVRCRGSHVGQLLASGSFWMPARMDLDTLLNKIDPRMVDETTIIKGPYSVMHGPGFNFVDFTLARSPRTDGGSDSGGSTLLEYQSNGGGFYGRQTFWAASEQVGVLASYGHKTRSDYTVGGNGQLTLSNNAIAALSGAGVSTDLLQPTNTVPSGYKSRDFNLAIGVDPTANSHLEFNYLRLDQTDVEFPGQVFDMDFMVTDGFDVEYILKDQELFDRLVVDTWYNQTRFEGSTRRRSKNQQIPVLLTSLGKNNGNPADSFAITDVDAYSAGYRGAVTWAQTDDLALTIGTDLTYLGQQLNDVEPNRPGRTNFPIPRSHSADVGAFIELQFSIGDQTQITSGARIDSVSTDARDNVAGVVNDDGTPKTISEDLHVDDLDRFFSLWSGFATAEHRLDERWTVNVGAGSARRALTLTELYAAQSFIALLQPGVPFLIGDPNLQAPRLKQFDFGLTGKFEKASISANGFYGWIHDYVTFDSIEDDPATFEPGQQQHRIAFTNTDEATLVGFELASSVEIHSNMTAFANVSYVEGTDRNRSEPSRIGAAVRPDRGRAADTARSEVAGFNEEPLPGILPLESIVGVRLHDSVENPPWAVELSARIVDDQDRVAATLFERPTPGFTIWNLRSYWHVNDSVTFTAGVENLTDNFYREHLDSRAGRGVYQPGINFFFSSEVNY
jgi:iron complex outermembrane recepter protein